MPHPPYRSINPHVLLEAVGHDAAAFRELSETFLRIAPPMLGHLENAMHDGDCARAALESHSLKSTSALVGAAALSGIFARLEQSARLGDKAGAAGALGEAAAEFAQVMMEVKDSISHAGPGGSV